MFLVILEISTNWTHGSYNRFIKSLQNSLVHIRSASNKFYFQTFRALNFSFIFLVSQHKFIHGRMTCTHNTKLLKYSNFKLFLLFSWPLILQFSAKNKRNILESIWFFIKQSLCTSRSVYILKVLVYRITIKVQAQNSMHK